MRGSMDRTDTVLTTYNGKPIPQYGTMRLRCSHDANRCEAMFFVADIPRPAIRGLPSCHELNLVVLNCEISETTRKVNTKEYLQRQYPHRFERIGKFRGNFHITLDPAVTPVIHEPRRCSINLKEEVKSELDSMEKMGVFKKPTCWVSSIVYSRKTSGKLRICLDPKDLTEAIKRPHYHTPTLEGITHKLAGSVMYSKLDARQGYWSVQLDEESKLLTTFNSPFEFASKPHSDCEQRYTNIEREMLAVFFGCERFHTYVFGKSFYHRVGSQTVGDDIPKELVSGPTVSPANVVTESAIRDHHPLQALQGDGNGGRTVPPA